jgi:hypothetical protein
MIKVITSWRKVNVETARAWANWPPSEKKCVDCLRTLTIDCFYAHTRYECGIPRIWQSYCKTCLRERNRFYARERRRRQGIPEHTGKPYKIRDGYREHGYTDLVPIEPFVKWLRAYINMINGRDSYVKHSNMIWEETGVRHIADRAEVDVELIRRLSKRRSGNITLGLVDRILIATGTSTQLWELYPDE